MKRLVTGFTIMIVLTIAIALTTLRTNSAAPNVASANGSGHSGEITLSFGAFDHGDDNITGQATFIDDFAKTKVTVDVNCLTVSGNTAAVGGIVTKSTNPSFPVTQKVVFYVLDNGEGQGAKEDNFSSLYVGGCELPKDLPVMMVSDIGNIQVRFNAPDKDCTKCPAGTHCGGNGECVGGGGSDHCTAGYKDCCGTCVPDDGSICPACPANPK